MDHGRRRPVDQPRQPAEFGHAGAGIGPGGAHQQMVGLVAAQHVVDEVGREADLAPGLALAGMLALDQPADHRHLTEGALEQIRLLDPVDELVLKDVRGQQGPRVGDRLQAVASQGIIVGDEAQWLEAGALHPPGDQHAQRLVRVPALEAVQDHEVAVLVREGLDQQLVGARQQ